MIKLKPIRNYADYLEAQKNLETLQDSDLDSENGQLAEVLSVLVESYERKMNPAPEDLEIEPLVDYVYDLVKNTSHLETGGILERGLKLSEESGELAAEILKFVGYKRNDLTKEKIKQNMLLESVDCLIVVFDIMVNAGFTKKEIVEMAENQVNKWLTNIKKEQK